MKIIEICGLHKRYPKVKRYRDILLHPFRREYVHALNGIDLRVEKGQMLGLLGPNGAGKTTLIKILATLVSPTSGNIQVNGLDIARNSMQARGVIGLVTADERSFYWRLTGKQNLEFFACLNNIPRKEVKDRVREKLEIAGLSEAADRMFKDYSTGMKQRLAIARGMLCNPQVLLLDEPTRSLDPYSAQKLRHFIMENIVRNHGHTAIIATHNLYEANSMCSHLAVMRDGRIILQGERRDVFSNTGTNTYEVTLSQTSPAIDFPNTPRITDYSVISPELRTYHIVTDEIEQVLHDLHKSGIRILECKKVQMTLDDFFITLMQRPGAQS